MAAYGRESFLYGDAFDDLDDFEDNLNDLEAPEDEDEEEEYFCLCGKANDDEMIMCEADECVGATWYHYECAGFPAGSEPDDNDKVWMCLACTGMVYFKLSLLFMCSIGMDIRFLRF